MGYRKDFIQSNEMEPHLRRKHEILAKHPQIQELEGYCPRTRYVCVFLVTLNLLVAWYVSDKPWWLVVILAYIISGTINNSLTLAGHELSHGLGFESQLHNDLMGFFCNISLGFPSTITFRKYHKLHHIYQGVKPYDTDIPSELEAKIVLNNRFTKLMFILLQPAFYALRPMMLYQTQTGMLEIINWAIVFTTDYLVLTFLGSKALFYLMVGSLLGLSIHPCAGHFLAEHYVWEEPTETYSYYGPLNFFAFNVGYHVEHHDFPRVPGSRLPKLREIAKEYYPANPKYQSWPGVMYRFVMDANMGTYNRVVRSQQVHESSLKKAMAEQRARSKKE